MKPFGPGSRLIIHHISSEESYLPEAMDYFIGEKVSHDYHHEMNFKHYSSSEILNYDLSRISKSHGFVDKSRID